MNLNQKIQSFLKEHRKVKRQFSVTALLSVVIALLVVSNLIMPAISVTIPNTVNVVQLRYAAMPGTYSTISGTDMLDLLSADTFDASVNCGDTQLYYQTSGGTSIHNDITANGSTVELDGRIKYNFNSSVKDYLTGSGPHLGWDLGNNDLTAIFLEEDDNGNVTTVDRGKVYDPGYQGGNVEAGTFVIENGIVKVTLTDAYINYVNDGSGQIEGELRFDGELDRANNESGDQKFVINGQEITIDFPDNYPTIDKSSSINESNGTINWKIDVTNSNYVDLENYTIEDSMLANAVAGTVKVSPPEAAEYKDGKIVFKADYADGATITYQTKITDAQLRGDDGSRTNHAELKKEDKKVDEDDETLNFWKEPFTVNKKGTADYKTPGVSHNNEINWEINIKNEYGGSLEGYLLEDSKIPSSGVTITPQGSLEKSGDKWKLTGVGNSSAVKIKYKTTVTDDAESKYNEVKLYYPTGDDTGKKDNEKVDYEDKNALITFTKSGYQDTSKGQIIWTITIKNQYGLDLDGYEISDYMLKDAVSFKINPDNAGEKSGGVITLNSNAKDAQDITITYATKITPEQLRNGTAENKAELKDPDGNKKTDEAKPTFVKNPFTINKTGEPDYKSGTYPDSGNEIKWRIDVKSDSGVSLEGYIIKDDKIPTTLSPIKTSSGTLRYTGSNEEWVLENTKDAKNIRIEYKAPVTETGGVGKVNTNDVELEYPDKEPTDKESTGSVEYKSKNDLVGLNKWGSYDGNSHEIEWTITVNIEGGFDITGYELYDDMFKNVDINDIQINYQPADTFAELNKDNGILKFTSKPNSNYFNITYTTKVENTKFENAGSEKITVSNGYGPGPGPGKQEANVDVPVKDKLNKTITSSPSEELDHSGKIERKLNWKSTIERDASFAGLTYTDTLEAPENGTHIMTDAQINAVKVYGRVGANDNRKLLTKGTDYDLNQTPNGFTITFKNTLDTAGYNYVDIEYQSTATSNKVASGTAYPVTSEFVNKATFKDHEVESKFTLKRNDPVIDTKLDLKLSKNWNSTSDSDIKPSVYFKVLYSTDWNTWQPIGFAADGKYLFKGDAGYDAANKIYTITGEQNSNQWNKTLSGLPRQIRKANADGSAGATVNYVYKIEEVNADGSKLENNLLQVDGGSYKVTYDNNNGAGNSNAVSISANNTLYRNTSVTPKKKWTGDTGYDSDITSIIVLLEYSVDDWNWCPVRLDANGNYTFEGHYSADNPELTQTLNKANNWTGTIWENLPTVIANNGNSSECKYRIREIGYTTKKKTEVQSINGNDTNTKYITDSGYFNISNNNNENDVVKNEYHKTKSIEHSAKKVWAGDTAYKEDRPDAIIVKLKQKANGAETEWTTETKTLNAENKWSCTWTGLPNQSIKDGTVVIYTYEAVEVKYVKDGKEIDITQDFFATSENGWYTISVNQPDNKNTTITNTYTPVETISITPQKQWVGDNELNSDKEAFYLKNRPQNVTLKLQRRFDNKGAWHDVPISAEDATPITVILSESNNLEYLNGTWQGNVIENLPTTLITIDNDGNTTKRSCEYRLVEWKYTPNSNSSDTSEKTLNSNDVSFKTADGKYNISLNSTNSGGNIIVTNTFEESIGVNKSIIDTNGDPYTTIDMQDLSQFVKEIGGEKYYVFNYLIEYDSLKTDLITPIKDVLPKGFTLIEDAKLNERETDIDWSSPVITPITPLDPNLSNSGKDGYYLSPCIIWPTANKVNGGQGANYIKAESSINDAWKDPQASPSRYYYDKTENAIYFGVPSISTVPIFTYSIKIEVEKLDGLLEKGSYSIKNDIERYTNDQNPTGQTASASLKIINKTPQNLITKAYDGKTNIPGYFKYSIDVNPEGRNLSTGDTIDIQDLLKTVSYFDADYQGGQTTPGNKLVDILMDSIEVYEVDANGSETLLPVNEYVCNFDNGDKVSGGTALLKLTIPDETHIKIKYTYKMIANENTPSVTNHCKSTVYVNGRLDYMRPGYVPPAKDKITFSNEAKLISDSASSTSQVNDTEYVVSKSYGNISTNKLPRIVKVNTGNYTINNLTAKFLLAKYEKGKWYYAININDGENGNNDRMIDWSSTGVSGSEVPQGVKLKKVDVNTPYEVQLGETVLYKLIEIKVPEGYEGSNLGLGDEEFENLITNYLNSGDTNYNGTDYRVFLNNYISTYYFSYNSIISDRPQEVPVDKIIQIKAGDDLNIPNNELIDIGIKKEWVNSKSTTNSKINVELYWSYTKASSGIPADAVLAKAEDLGIISKDFNAKQTINIEYNANGTVKPNEQVWKDLPNGKNSKPIYYYVKETGYTIGGKTYTQDKDGNFKTSSGEIGSYRPTYVGNAANTDTTVDIQNSSQLLLKKSWKNSANVELKNIPVESVTVSIYGIDEDGVKTSDPLFKDITLSSKNKWQSDLTKMIPAGVDLSKYKSFVAEENESSSLEDYVVSCVFNLNAQTGEIIVTNKNTIPTEAAVKVNKVWSDGKDIHANESIKVSLYQTTTKLSNLDNLDGKLRNVPIMKQIDANDKQQYENVILNADNDWSYSWSGLPLEDEDQNKYYYYVLENKTGITDADKYTASYQIAASTPTKTEYTVTNTRQALVIQKQWLDENGEVLPDSEVNQDQITLDVYKKVVNKPTDGIKLIAFGDSITDGYNGSAPDCSKNGKDYPSKLINLLKSSNYTITNADQVWDFNKGVSQQQIGGSANEGFRSRISSAIPSDTDIICFIGGTNDIHQGGSSVKGAPQGVYDRFDACITEIKAHASDAVIFVGSIPHFDFYKNGSETDGGKWWNWLTDYNKNDGAIPNDLIDQYNAKIKTYAESTDGVYFVDVCDIITDDDIRDDGCHPNEQGYTKIANAFYEKINEFYNQESIIGEITLTKENNWIGAFDIDDADPNAEYYIDESTIPANWTVSYSNQNQKLGTNIPIIAKNTRNIPKTSISVEKTWKGDRENDPKRDAISFTLLRSIDKTNWVECEVEMPTPTKNDNVWTYEYTNLPAKDMAGRTYHYKLEEAPMTGYTASAVSPATLPAKSDSSAGTFKLTNTAAIKLNIQKEWSDGDPHLNDNVTFTIHRAVKGDPEYGIDEEQLILELDKTTVGVTVGSSVEVKANKPVTVTQSEESKSFFEVSVDGKNITVTGKNEVTGGTFTVTDGTDEIEVTVNVSAYKLLLDDGENFTITAGEQNHTLSVTKGGNSFTDVTYSSDNETVLTVDSDGKITTKNAGTATVTVSTGGGVILTQDITVKLPEEFAINGVDKVVIGSEIQLSVSPSYGTFTWRSSDDAIATVDTDGKVTGVAEGKVTITATRNDGKPMTFDVSVIDGGTSFSVNDGTIEAVIDKTKKVSEIVIELDKTSIPSENWLQLYVKLQYYDIWTNEYWPHDEVIISYKINNELKAEDNGVKNSENAKISFDDNKITIELLEPSKYDYSAGDAKLIISGDDGTKWAGKYRIVYLSEDTQQVHTLSLRNASQVKILAAAETAETIDGAALDFPYEVTMYGGSAEGWKKTIENLPVYDPDGNEYYYWVEETVGLSNYKPSYQFKDSDPDSTGWLNAAKTDENGELTAIILNTKTEELGVVMPSTGGSGTAPYHTVGMIIAGGAIIAFTIRRRRKKSA